MYHFDVIYNYLYYVQYLLYYATSWTQTIGRVKGRHFAIVYAVFIPCACNIFYHKQLVG